MSDMRDLKTREPTRLRVQRLRKRRKLFNDKQCPEFVNYEAADTIVMPKTRRIYEECGSVNSENFESDVAKVSEDNRNIISHIINDDIESSEEDETGEAAGHNIIDDQEICVFNDDIQQRWALSR